MLCKRNSPINFFIIEIDSGQVCLIRSMSLYVTRKGDILLRVNLSKVDSRECILLPFLKSVLLFFFYCYFVVFQGQIAANSNFILATDIVQSQVSSGFFLPVGLVYDTEYFPLQDLTAVFMSKEVFKSNVISRKFSYCAIILLNLSVKIMRMFVSQSFLVCCRSSLSTLYTVVYKL